MHMGILPLLRTFSYCQPSLEEEDSTMDDYFEND